MDSKRERRRTNDDANDANGAAPRRRRPARTAAAAGRTREHPAAGPRVRVPRTESPEASGEADPADIEPDIDPRDDPVPPEDATADGGGYDGLIVDHGRVADDPLPDDERTTWSEWDEEDRT